MYQDLREIIFDKEEFHKRIAVGLAVMVNESGMTQKEVARKAGVTESVLSLYIHGIKTPSLWTWCKLMKAME